MKNKNIQNFRSTGTPLYTFPTDNARVIHESAPYAFNEVAMTADNPIEKGSIAEDQRIRLLATRDCRTFEATLAPETRVAGNMHDFRLLFGLSYVAAYKIARELFVGNDVYRYKFLALVSHQSMKAWCEEVISLDDKSE